MLSSQLFLLFLFCSSVFSVTAVASYVNRLHQWNSVQFDACCTSANTSKTSIAPWSGNANSLDAIDLNWLDAVAQPGADCWVTDKLELFDVPFSLPLSGLSLKTLIFRVHKSAGPDSGGYANTMTSDWNITIKNRNTGVECGYNPSKSAYDGGGYWLQNGQTLNILYSYSYPFNSICPGLFSNINDVNTGLQVNLVAIISRPSVCLGFPNGGWANRHARINYAEIEVQMESNWSLSQIFPNNTENQNPPSTLMVQGTGFSDNGQLRCKYTYLTKKLGRENVVNATYINGTHLTCDSVPVLSNDTYETASVEVSLNGGVSYTNDGLIFEWRRFCGNPSGKPMCNSHPCNYTTGICICASYSFGDTCEADCVATNSFTDGSRCTKCINTHENCFYCFGNGVCGPSCGNDPLNSTTGCFEVDSVDQEYVASDGSQNVTFSGTFPISEPFNCSFGSLGEIPATFDSLTGKGNCSTPPWPSKKKSLNTRAIDGTIQLNFKHDGELLQQTAFTLSFGVPEDPSASSGTKDSSSYFAAIGGSASAGGLLLLLFIVAYVKYRQKLAADKFRSLFQVPVFSLQSAFSVIYPLTYSEKSWFKKTGEKVWYLEELVSSSDRHFIKAFVDTFESHESDDLSKALIYVLEKNGEAVDALKFFMKEEFTRAPNGVQLFRGYNVASKMWTGYLKLDHGLEYIHSCLARTLYELCSELGYEEDTLQLDIDRAAETNQSVHVNKYRLMAGTQKIFESILGSIDQIPLNISHIMVFTRQECTKKFPDYIHRTIGNFMFLRLFCPAIAAPEVYGLLNEEPDENARSLLILVARVLQNLANGVEFGVKDLAMKQMNDFIRTNQETINSFFDSITNNCDVDDIPTVQKIDEDVIQVSLIMIYHYLYSNHDSINAQLAKITDQKVRDQVTSKVNSIIEALGEPPTLEYEEDGI